MELRVCLKFHQHYHSEQYEEFESHLQILRKVQDDIKNDSQWKFKQALNNSGYKKESKG